MGGGVGDIVKWSDPSYYATGMKKSYMVEGVGGSTTETKKPGSAAVIGSSDVPGLPDMQTGIGLAKVNKAIANAPMEEAARRNAALIAEAQAAKERAGAMATESVASKKRAIARSRTVYTSPLGLSTEAQTASKMLLGQ